MHAYFDKRIETSSRKAIEEGQFKRLKAMVETSYEHNLFYKRKFTEHGVVPEDIRSIKDITKLPFLYKREITEDQGAHPPYGSNLLGGLEEFVRYHQTTGTTGHPVRWLDTRESWMWRGRCSAMALTGAGVTAKDIIFFPFAFGPHVAYWGLWEGAYQIGALAIAGGGWNTLQRVKAIFDTNATVVMCTPTYAVRMAEVAHENDIDLRTSGVRITFHAGEPGALIPAVRSKIMESWGAKPFDYLGLTEVGGYSIHCLFQDGAIHVNEAEFILEVIDPRTGDLIEGDGTGEMVLTNLGRTSSPSIRFRTGDLVKVNTRKCSCGRAFRLLDGGVIARVDDMVTVRGINIFPSQVQAVVEKHLEVGEEYRVIAYTEKGMAELKVTCEFLDNRPRDTLLKRLEEELRNAFEIRIRAEAVPKGAIERSEFKSKRFIDMRKI